MQKDPRDVDTEGHGPSFHCGTCTCSSQLYGLGSLEPPIPSMKELVQELEDMERRAASIRTRIADALRRRNSQLSVYRLPIEVLGEIFLLCRSTTSKLKLKWIVVSHISHTWRQVALSHSILWTSPDLLYFEYAVEMLRRSGLAPVTLRYTESTIWTGRLKNDDARRQECVAEMPRTANIQNIHFVGADLNMLSHWVTAYAQGLLSVVMCNTLGSGHLDSDLLSAHYPALRTLDITDIGIGNWSASLFRSPQLRTLRVIFESTMEDEYTLEDILNLLESLPRLEDLSLEHAIPEFEGTMVATRRRVPLIHLHHLVLLSGYPDSCSALFRHLAIPLETDIHLGFSAVPDEQDLVDALALTMRRATHVYMMHYDLDVLHLFASAEQTPYETYHKLTLATPSYAQEYVDNMLLKISNTIATCSARALALFDPRCEIPEVLLRALSTAEMTLLHVQLSEAPTLGFLSDHCLYNVCQMLGRGVLPRLDTLILEGLKLDQTNLTCTAYDLASIVDTLHARAESYGALKLQLVDITGLKSEQLSAYRALVPVDCIEGPSALGKWVELATRRENGADDQ